MKFEIINPSDPYTMEADDLEIAAVAVSYLGSGKYPLQGLGDDAGQDVPPFIFGGHDEWFTEKFGSDFGLHVRGLMSNASMLWHALSSQ